MASNPCQRGSSSGSIDGIDSFWKWFVSSRRMLQDMIDQDEYDSIDSLLSPRIKELGDGLAWEVGPGLKKDYSLTISPNLDADRLSATEVVISNAPTIAEWEFHSARPPKSWQRSFVMTNRNGQAVTIDASQWKYFLRRYAGKSRYGIVLAGTGLPKLDRPARNLAASILLEGELGERQFLETIDGHELVDMSSVDDPDSLSDIAVLQEHLNWLMKHG